MLVRRPTESMLQVFMSYESLRKELGHAERSRLLQFGFWRVMLDEAQLVAASSSAAARMTSALWRRHAWVITGTPITARTEEIQVRLSSPLLCWVPPLMVPASCPTSPLPHALHVRCKVIVITRAGLVMYGWTPCTGLVLPLLATLHRCLSLLAGWRPQRSFNSVKLQYSSSRRESQSRIEN